MILECKMLIEKVTADAAKEIVRGRRYPITQVENIIEYEHNGSANNSVDNSHHDKLHKGFVSE